MPKIDYLPSAQPAIDHLFSMIETISSMDKVGIICDTDADGLSSTVILKKALKKWKKIDAEFLVQPHTNHFLTDEMIGQIKRKKINKVFSVDFSFDQNQAQLEKLSKWVDWFIVIDHHSAINPLNNKKIFVFKPHLLTNSIPASRYNTSKLVWDVFSKKVDLTDLKWVAGLGIVGDLSNEVWKGFLKEGFKKFKLSYSAGLKLFISVSGIIAGIENVEPKKLIDFLKALEKAKKPKELFQKKFVKLKEKYAKEIGKWVNAFETNSIEVPEKELFILNYLPKFSVKSILSSELSFKPKFLHSTICILENNGKGITFVSLRRQDWKINLPKLFLEAQKTIPSVRGGGHIPASGGKVDSKDVDKFIDFLKKHAMDEKFVVPIAQRQKPIKWIQNASIIKKN